MSTVQLHTDKNAGCYRMGDTVYTPEKTVLKIHVENGWKFVRINSQRIGFNSLPEKKSRLFEYVFNAGFEKQIDPELENFIDNIIKRKK